MKNRFKYLIISSVILHLPISCSGPKENSIEIPVYKCKVIKTYLHNRESFTQGLVYYKGFLYEGTGQNEKSSIMKVELETGEIVKSRDISVKYFGEGITIFDNKIIQLTWHSNIGFIYDVDTFEPLDKFNYPVAGWGITHDGTNFIMSNGTSIIRYWNPDTFKEIRQIEVHDENGPVTRINELEYIKGEIYANIWGENHIVRISPETGKITGWIELDGLLQAEDYLDKLDVPNGIAYDAENDRLFVTGKLWPKLFEIDLILKE
ncbi:MAG: glutaminyl-peptide cyclotransferase [candidate division Zixibacteria bacterium]|nr:glutaminyl-peptide cyclotransferase [candidate division Zixibacteria bacterium]